MQLPDLSIPHKLIEGQACLGSRDHAHCILHCSTDVVTERCLLFEDAYAACPYGRCAQRCRSMEFTPSGTSCDGKNK